MTFHRAILLNKFIPEHERTIYLNLLKEKIKKKYGNKCYDEILNTYNVDTALYIALNKVKPKE